MFKKLFGKKEEAVSVEDGKVYAPQSGVAIDLTEMPDEMFAGKMLGDGFGVIPNDGKVYSPVAGEIVTVANTLHAFGIKTPSGMEFLVHVGLETVALKGEGFKVSVKQGDHVKAGELLAEVDLDFIESKGCKRHTAVVLTNAASDVIQSFTPGDVTGGQSAVLTYKVK